MAEIGARVTVGSSAALDLSEGRAWGKFFGQRMNGVGAGGELS